MATTTNLDYNPLTPISTWNQSTQPPPYNHNRHRTSASNDTAHTAITPSDALFDNPIVGPLTTPQNEDEILTPVSVWGHQHQQSVQACTTITTAHNHINSNVYFGLNAMPLSTLTSTAFMDPNVTLSIDTTPSIDSFCWTQPVPTTSAIHPTAHPFIAFDRTRHQSINNCQPPVTTSIPLDAPKHMRASTYAPMSTFADAAFAVGGPYHPVSLQPSSSSFLQQSNENTFLYHPHTLSLSSISSDSSTTQSTNSSSSNSNSCHNGTIQLQQQQQEANSLVLTNPFNYAVHSSSITSPTAGMNSNNNAAAAVVVMDPIDAFIASANATTSASTSAGVINDARNTTTTTANLSQQLLEHRQRNLRFEIVMEAKTAVTSRKESCPMTYLNRNQLYAIHMRDTTQANEIIRSTLSLGFHLLEHRQTAEAKWKFRADHIKQGDPRIIDLEMEESAGISEVMISSPDDSSNLISFNWNGRFGATLYVKFMCLSTDFLETKGVKGIPLRAQVDSYVPANDLAQKPALDESCYAVVKLFRDKGAERKNKDNDRQVDKHLEKAYGKVTDEFKSSMYYMSLPKTLFQQIPLPPLLEAFEQELNETVLAAQQQQRDEFLLSTSGNKKIPTAAAAAVTMASTVSRKNHARSKTAPYTILQRSSAIRRTPIH